MVLLFRIGDIAKNLSSSVYMLPSVLRIGGIVDGEMTITHTVITNLMESRQYL